MYERELQEEEIPRIVEFLKTIELFRTLDDESLTDLAKSLTLYSLGGGDTLIHQGELDSTLYILYHGRLRVLSGLAGIAEISVGQVVGEIALLTGAPRTATVKAIRDSTLLKLRKHTFERFEKKHPEAVIEMGKDALKRVISKPRLTQPGENVVTIAVAPASNSNHIPFLKALVAHLDKIKPTLLVNKERVNHHFGKKVAEANLDDVENIHINNWLGELENSWGYLVYETDKELTPWTMRCIRQSDRLFLVAEEGKETFLNEIEKKLFEKKEDLSPCIDIVFIHPERKAEGTAAWLELRPLDNYHHLRLNSEDDFSRLIRFLTGKAFGVVLNGGGVRGFAHSGVLQVIDELNVPIDFIGGSSAGALVAAMYAEFSGKEATEICKYKKELGLASRDYTLPLISLLRGKNASKIYHRIAGEQKIEDLWTRFFCVSTNVTKGTLEIHKEGTLWVALRASTAIPGIYPPIFNEKGEMLVDGGVLDNMPVGIMRRFLGGGKILGVNCHTKMQELSKHIFKETWFSGWRLFFNKINPFIKKSKKFPTIFEILRTSLSISAEEQQKKNEKEADFLLSLDTAQFALLDFENRKQIVEIGYNFALQELPKLLSPYIKSK